MSDVRPTTGTLVPAQLSHLTPPLEAQALREAARTLLRVADGLDGKASRVTFMAPEHGQCGTCGQDISGRICPDCGPYGGPRNLGEQELIARLDT